MTTSELDLMTVEEVATATKRSASAVRQALQKHQLPGMRLGRRWFVRRRDIHRLFDASLAADDPDPRKQRIAAATNDFLRRHGWQRGES